MQLDHERLEVFHRALEAHDICNAVLEAAIKCRAHHRDQLDRAVTSVVLNIAEGAGEFSGREKKRFYRMAKRSATECAGLVHIMVRREWISVPLGKEARGQLARVIAMLVPLIK